MQLVSVGYFQYDQVNSSLFVITVGCFSPPTDTAIYHISMNLSQESTSCIKGCFAVFPLEVLLLLLEVLQRIFNQASRIVPDILKNPQ